VNLVPPVPLPTGARSLPPLGGGLLGLYRVLWCGLLVLAIGASLRGLFAPGANFLIIVLGLAKSIVLVAVAAILFRRRHRDPVAALLGLSFLLWTISSSASFTTPPLWLALADRLRFLPFALALLLFPNGEWSLRRTAPIAASILVVFAIGAAEVLGLLQTRLYLPLAVGCVLLALASLLARYRSQPRATQQQLKWVTLGLVLGIALILSARAGAALADPAVMPMAGTLILESLFQLGIVVIALGFLTSLLRYRLYDAEAAISRSAAYAGLTLALVGTFAASEAIIQSLGQRYFGPNVGELSGGIAAAIAAVLLTPLNNRISRWAEERFQRDLIRLKSDLPELLARLAGGCSLARLGSAVLPHIQEAVHATHIALVVQGRTVASRGVGKERVGRWLRQVPAGTGDPTGYPLFPVTIDLGSPLTARNALLLLGPRPDGSAIGKDELEAMADVERSLRQAIFQTAQSQRAEQRRLRTEKALRDYLRTVAERLDRLEAERCPTPA
jgi:hypothetical protein